MSCAGIRYQCGENGTLYLENPDPNLKCVVDGVEKPFTKLSEYPCYSGYWNVLHSVTMPLPQEIESPIQFRTRDGKNTTESRQERDTLMKQTYQQGETYECFQQDQSEEEFVNPFQRNNKPGQLVWGRRERRKTWAAMVILFVTACLMGFLATVTLCMLRGDETGAQKELKRRLLVRDDVGDASSGVMMEMHGAQVYDLLGQDDEDEHLTRRHDDSDTASGFETEEEVDQVSEVGEGFRRMVDD